MYHRHFYKLVGLVFFGLGFYLSLEELKSKPDVEQGLLILGIILMVIGVLVILFLGFDRDEE